MGTDNFNKYIKRPKERNHHVTSVNISHFHRTFLEEQKINLSYLIRDILDNMIRDSRKINKDK